MTRLAVPLVFFAVSCWLIEARGPSWLSPNLDPDYHYLTNALLLATGEPPAYAEHPGTSAQWLAAAVIRLANPMATRAELTEEVLTRPETHLLLLQLLSVALLSAALVFVGVAVFQATGSRVAAFAVQALPMTSPTVMREVLGVKPEPLLSFCGLVIGAIAIRSTAKPIPKSGTRWPILMGLLCAIAVTAKITALPLLLVPFGILAGRRARGIFCLSTLAGGAAIVFSSGVPLEPLFLLARKILMGSGQYGSGAAPAGLDRSALATLRLLAQEPSFGAALVLSWVAGVVALRRRSERRVSVPGSRRPALALAAALTLQALLASGHPYETRYLIPGLVLSGPALLAALLFVWPTAAPSMRRPAAAAVVAVLAAGVAGATLVTRARLVAGAQAAREVDVTLAERFPTTPVVSFYRASQPSFALRFGNQWAAHAFEPTLSRLYPEAMFYDIWARSFGDFSAYTVPAHYAVTSHEFLLRGTTPDVVGEFASRPELQEPVTHGKTEALYRVRLLPTVVLPFGDFVAAGLSRPIERAGGAEPVRAMSGKSFSLRLAVREERQRLEGVALNANDETARLAIEVDGRMAGEWTIPPRAGSQALSLSIAGGPAGSRTVTFARVDGGAQPVVFSRLRLVSSQATPDAHPPQAP